MCGIAGIVNFHKFENKDNSIRQLKMMTENLKHRGPDSIGYIFKKII
jgi:asparagine synthetase B (glutamine-hydrolysing)